MNKEKIIWVKINTNSYYNIFIKLNDMGITIYDNKKIDNNIIIKTNYEDYLKMKKYLISYKIDIYDTSGILKIKEIFNKYIVFTIGMIFSIILLFIVNNLIYKIDIKSANKNIRELVKNELENNGITILRFKKKHKDIEKIVSNILDNNKDTLEWLEIKYDGLVMIVNVTEKTPTEEEESYQNCNIIATSDAKITSLNIYRGVALKEINDYVLKGEVILSGSIMHNEEIKNTVCASGEVYGEVWYKLKVEVPFKENYLKYTGKSRYNLNIKIDDDKYKILKSRIKKHKDEETNLYKLNDFEINLVKEKEYTEETRFLTEEDAYNKGMKLGIDKIKLNLDDKEEILLKKVLKKEVNNSTIYLEIFVVTKENIGKRIIVKEESPNGSRINQESIQ